MSSLPARLRKLSLLGCASALLYVMVAAIFWTDAVFHRTPVIDGILYATLAALTILYFLGISRIRHESARTVVIFAMVFALLGFITSPFDSTDVFFYMAQGWVQTEYSANPYAQVLRDIPDGLQDPMIGTRWMQRSRNPWLDEPMPYGFAFALVTHGVAWLGQGHFWVTLVLFSWLNLGVHAGICYLLWKTAALIPRADPKLILYLYAWSPLVVLQYLANVHNDLIMAALIVLAYHLLLRKRMVLVLPVLIAAGLVKYVAFALTPFALAYTVRRYGWKTALNAILLSMVFVAAVSLPYIGDIRSFKVDAVVKQYTESSGSLHAFAVFTYRAVARMVSWQPIQMTHFSILTKVLLWVAVGAIALYQFGRARTGMRDGASDVGSRWTSILFAVIFVGSSQFYTWYIGMLFPLSVLGAGKSRLTELVVLLSGTHMAFSFLRGKAIGYFLISTAIPIAYILWRRRKLMGVFLAADNTQFKPTV